MKTGVPISFRETFVLTSHKKSKKQRYRNLNIKNIKNNKAFWKTLKLFFNNKASNSGKITLVENDAITSDDKEIAKTMNQFFINIIKN